MKVALLRGINVGGNNIIEMSKLKTLFEELGAVYVKTLLNTGNIIFKESTPISYSQIRNKIKDIFDLDIEGVIYSKDDIEMLVNVLPESWVTDKEVQTNVMFYISKPDDLPQHNQYVEALESNIALIWHSLRANATKTQANKLIGTPFYKAVTIRNANTVRKILTLMKQDT